MDSNLDANHMNASPVIKTARNRTANQGQSSATVLLLSKEVVVVEFVIARFRPDPVLKNRKTPLETTEPIGDHQEKDCNTQNEQRDDQ